RAPVSRKRALAAFPPRALVAFDTFGDRRVLVDLFREVSVIVNSRADQARVDAQIPRRFVGVASSGSDGGNHVMDVQPRAHDQRLAPAGGALADPDERMA